MTAVVPATRLPGAAGVVAATGMPADHPGIRLASALILVAMGVAIGLVGWYGWNHGASLIPRTTDERQLPHRLAVVRRGSVACMVVGVLLVVMAVVAGVS